MHVSGCALFYDEQISKIKEQNPDMKMEDINKKLEEMWLTLSPEEWIPYYVKAAIEEMAKKVFYEEKNIILKKNECPQYKIYAYNAIGWDTLTDEEHKPYIEKATMSLTAGQAIAYLPRKLTSPFEIFRKEKGIYGYDWVKKIENGKEIWNALTEEEKKPYEDKALENIKILEQNDQTALKVFNDEKAKIIKKQKQEELKNEVFEHMNSLKQKEQELNVKEAKLIHEEELLNKRKARFVKKEEYFQKVYILITLFITFLVFIMTK